MKRYLLNIIIAALDCTANALFCGSPYETISSRCGRGHPRLAALINRLFGDPTHCTRAQLLVGSPSLAVPVRQRWAVVAFWALLISLAAYLRS